MSRAESSGILSPRDAVAELSAYDPGKFEYEINLSANENPYDLPSDLKAAVMTAMGDLPFNRYPDPPASELRVAIAARYGLEVDNVVVGNGSDELIQDLLLAYGGRSRTAVTFEPTFVMYSLIAELTDTKCVALKRRRDFSLPKGTADLVDSVDGDIVFICSPNNPTGTVAGEDDLKALLSATGRIIVVDEAYEEFSKTSVTGLLRFYPNLVVLRTFSKAFSLAGLRVGYMLGSPKVIANVLKVKMPYNVNALSQTAATALMRNQGRFDAIIDEILSERDRLLEALGDIKGLTVYPSAANFILVRAARSGETVWRKLLDKGILVRYFSRIEGLTNCLRITVGKPSENDRLLQALTE